MAEIAAPRVGHPFFGRRNIALAWRTSVVLHELALGGRVFERGGCRLARMGGCEVELCDGAEGVATDHHTSHK